ncbi:dTDP-4-dehydrorhamnose 3,5-epimerase family protein [Patescibacteria group bacterium]
MIKGVIIKKLNKYNDKRGWLAEGYRKDEIDFNPAMLYISITKPKVIRGPHEHKEQSDFFIFLGSGDFELYLWDNRKKSKTYKNKMRIKVGEKNPVKVIVPPGVVHGYKCISKIEAMSFNLPDKLYKGNGKKEDVDEIRWEDDDNSPFKII